MPMGTDTTFVHALSPAPRTHRITITNFCLGKHLVSEGDLLKDQRGSPAYISPDVLSGMCVVPVSGPQGRCPAGLHRGSFLQQSVSWGRGSPGLGAGAVGPSVYRIWGHVERKMGILTPVLG